MIRGWWNLQLAFKLAHEFALRLDELYQFFISHVVKVAGLADFFLLGEQVQFAAQQFQSRLAASGAPPVRASRWQHFRFLL